MRWGGEPDVGSGRQKSSSQLGNVVFVWCRLNFCTGKIYIWSIFGTNLGIICENRGTQDSLLHDMYLLFCGDADWIQPSRRPTLNAGSFGEQQFSESSLNNIADISSNLGEFWMENGWVIPEYRPAIQPARCIFRLALLCLRERGRACTWCWAFKAEIVLTVGKSSLCLVQTKFLHRRKFAPYLDTTVELFAGTEAHGDPCSAVIQIECSPVEVPPWRLVVLQNKDFQKAR